MAVCLARPCFGQTTGRVEGRVADGTGAALGGVTVTLGGPALQGFRTTTADGDGRFRFLALPPGRYKLKASLNGFATVERSNMSVQLDTTTTLDLSLGAAGPNETITVTDVAPTIDVTSTTSGGRFDAQLVERLPFGRDYQTLALAVPGVTAGGLGVENPSVAGASAAENRYVVDGLDITDPAFGTSNVPVPMEFIEEVDIKTGGYEAEYGGALGGVLNVVTKSGANAFKGDVFAYYSEDGLRSTSPRTETNGQNRGVLKLQDFGVDVGGKLVEDRLWYFAALDATRTDNGWETYTRNRHLERRRNILYSGKLTWQAVANHSIAASLFGGRGRVRDAPTGFTRGAPTAGLLLANDDTSTYNYNVVYNGILGSKALLKVSVGRSDQNERSSPGADSPFYVDNTPDARFVRRFAAGDCGDLSTPRAGIRFTPSCRGGAFAREAGDRSRDELKGSFSLFSSTGRVTHEWKAGGAYRRLRYHEFSHYPAPIPGPLTDEAGVLVSQNGVAGQRYALRANSYRLVDEDQNSKGDTRELGLFLQDQVRFGARVTLNLGLRFDWSKATGAISASSANHDRELGFGLADTIAPRLGLVVDPSGRGTTKVFAHYGRFYESIPLDVNVRAFGTESVRIFDFLYPSDGSLPSGANQGVLYNAFVLGTGTGTKVQDGLRAMYSEEYAAGVERRLGKHIAVGIRGVYRDLGEVVEDISVDGGETFFITNVGRETRYSSNPVTGEPLAEPITFPAAVRRYKALELTIGKALSDNWQLNASYVLSRSYGNYGGLFRQDTGQLDPNVSSLFDLPSLLKGADGLLPTDSRHQLKAYGTYRLPFSMTLGVFGQYLSGTPISRLGAHTNYGRRERFIGDRGGFGRTPPLWYVDVHLEYPMKLSSRFGLRLLVDAFNVTNQKAAVRVDQEWTLNALAGTLDVDECGGTDPSCPGANRTYGLATAFQDPRTLRFGVKLGW
jgi:outer membrane receptor protein involved in Fe transport